MTGGSLIGAALHLFTILGDVGEWWRYRGWRSWPLAEGSIEMHVREQQHDPEMAAPAQVGYSYYVEGERYAGWHSDDDDLGELLFDEYPVGMRVGVRYHPRAPDRSRLDPAESVPSAPLRHISADA